MERYLSGAQPGGGPGVGVARIDLAIPSRSLHTHAPHTQALEEGDRQMRACSAICTEQGNRPTP